jgi:hypothetical protein
MADFEEDITKPASLNDPSILPDVSTPDKLIAYSFGLSAASRILMTDKHQKKNEKTLTS